MRIISYFFLLMLNFACSAQVLNIYFEKNQFTLSEASKATLDSLCSATEDELLKGEENRYYYELGGYTDSIGSKEYNLRLSALRAQEVAYYLKYKSPLAPIHSNQRLNFPRYYTVDCVLNSRDSIVDRPIPIFITTSPYGEAFCRQNAEKCRKVSIYKRPYDVRICGGVLYQNLLPAYFDKHAVSGLGIMCFPPGSISSSTSHFSTGDTSYTYEVSALLLDSVVKNETSIYRFRIKLMLNKTPQYYRISICENQTSNFCYYLLPGAYMQLEGYDSVSVQVNFRPNDCSTQHLSDSVQTFYSEDCRIPAQWFYDNAVTVTCYRHTRTKLGDRNSAIDCTGYLLTIRGKAIPALFDTQGKIEATPVSRRGIFKQNKIFKIYSKDLPENIQIGDEFSETRKLSAMKKRHGTYIIK